MIHDAKELLTRRLNHQNLAEETINERKKGKICRSTAGSPTLAKIKPNNLFLRKNEEERSLYHKLYEDNLDKNYEDFYKKLKECDNKRCEMRENISNLREELKENQEELEKSKKELEDLEKKRKKQMIKGQDIAKYFSRRMTLREELIKNEIRHTEISEELTVEVNKKSKIIESLDQECTVFRKELNIIRDAQIKHYSSLLMEGKDSRSDGIQ